MSNNQMQIQPQAPMQTQPQAQRPKFSAMISTKGYQKMINNTLKDPARAKRFVAAITSAVATNPALQECDPKTILSGALLGESLNLSPSPQLGQYYLVPFECKVKGPDGKAVWLLDEAGNHVKDKNGKWMALTEKVAQFQLGYKGYIQLALRSGYYKRLNVLNVKVGELQRWNPLTEELQIELMEDEVERENAETVGYVASFEYLNGFAKTIYWSREKMEAHALKYSKGYAAKKGYTFWEKDFDAMAFKTMLRQLISKWGVMSTELQQAYEADVVAEDTNYVVTDDTPDAPQNLAAEFPMVGTEVTVDTLEDAEEVDLNEV